MTFLVRPLEKRVTFGEELRALRLRQAISLDMAAAGTKIQKKYLKALEGGDWDHLPEPVYTRNYLRTYARFLGADVTYMTSRFEKERACCDFLGTCQVPRQRIRGARLLVTTRILRFGILTVLLATLLGYFAFQVRGILEPPMIVVMSPENGANVASAMLAVSGTSEKETQLFVNHQPVLPDPTGNFEAEITLERGLNVIEIEAKKRYSRSAVIHRTVIFEPSIVSKSDAVAKLDEIAVRGEANLRRRR